MAPAACAPPMYLLTAADGTAWSIQYAWGVLAIAASWALPGLAFAARMAAESGSTYRGSPATGFTSSANRTAGPGSTCTGIADEINPATAATAIKATTHRETAPGVDDITPGKLVRLCKKRQSPT